MFQLLRVQVSDMAGYLCVAENKVGTVEKLFSLTVQGKECPLLLSSLCYSLRVIHFYYI